MKLHRLWLALFLGLALACPLRAEQPATVKGTRVNVRGQASLRSERITQLEQGESVVILEIIEASNPKPGEPTRWARIQLPSDTPVFVFAPYIDPNTKTVQASRLNLRGGPGENYSVLGRILRGTAVREVSTTDKWMQIEAPPEAYAFVALDYLAPDRRVITPAMNTEPLTVTPTEPGDTADASAAEETLTVEAIENDPILVDVTPVATLEVVETDAGEPGDEGDLPPVITIPVVEVEVTPEPAPPRIVIREGRVVYSRSIQAPTRFALESQGTLGLINYLHTEESGLNLKAFAGRQVFVTGEELLDARWANSPILDVQDIRIAP